MNENNFFEKSKKILLKYVNKEIVSYLFFGVLTTVVSYSTFAATVYIMGGDDQDRVVVFVSNCVSWVFAVAFAYITNKIYVFKSKDFSPKVLLKEISAFASARLFSFGFEIVFIDFMLNIFSVRGLISKILANVIVTIMNYFFSKFFIFKNKK